MQRKNKIPEPPRLLPGEINQLRDLVEIAMKAKHLIGEEIERLEKLRSNPTFPATQYSAQVGAIRIIALHLNHIAGEVKS